MDAIVILAAALILTAVLMLAASSLAPPPSWKKYYSPGGCPSATDVDAFIEDDWDIVDWSAMPSEEWVRGILPKLRLMEQIVRAEKTICAACHIDTDTGSHVSPVVWYGYLLHAAATATSHKIPVEVSLRTAAFFFYVSGFAADPDDVVSRLTLQLPLDLPRDDMLTVDAAELPNLLKVIVPCFPLSESLTEDPYCDV
jgi:hypothetical protein